MNQSSYSFDESSIWDPKVIRQHLCIPEDHLNILCTLPEWTKVQDNRDTFRIEKDSSIGNSQFHCSLTQNIQRIREKNFGLFDKSVNDRRHILKTYKVYRDKLTRSISLFDIVKTSKDLPSSSSLKRTLSSPTLYQSSDLFHIKYRNRESSIEDSSPGRYSPFHFNRKELLICRPVKYPVILDKNKTDPEGSEDLFCSKKISSEVMEVVSQLPINISTHVEKVTSKESNFEAEENDLSAQHTTVDSNNSGNQPVRSNVDEAVKNENLTIKEANKLTESHGLNSSENSKLDASSTKETVPVDGMSATVNENLKMALHSEESAKLLFPSSCDNKADSFISKETVPDDVGSVTDNENVKMNLNAQVLAESHVPMSCESKNSDLNSVKGIVPVDIGSAAVNGNVEVNLNVQKLSEVNETSKKCLESLEVPSKEQSIPKGNLASDNKYLKENSASDNKYLKENLASDNKYLKENSASDNKYLKENSSTVNTEKMDDTESAQEICHKEMNINPASLETAVSGKRKLESKNKRSKKRKSEGKQHSVKIRSIKKVSEVWYLADDIKTMLNIMKPFF